MNAWLIEFEHAPMGTNDDIEGLCFELVEAGALGAHILDRNRIGVFVNGLREEANTFASNHCTHPLLTFTVSAVEDKNWVQECQEVLQPITAGTLTVRPIISSEGATSPNASTIYLIPGLGFGTGHHETTRCALTLLQHPFIKESIPQKVLDVGTGSGILAIGAALLYNSTVTAFDVDPLAVDNAQENVSMNRCQDRVVLHTGEIEDFQGIYDLIIANIYAEVLVELEKSIRERLSPGKPLIISGIMQSRLGLVEESYRPASWRLIETLQDNGWITQVYERL